MKRTELLVAVIDGQGGGMGRALTEAVKKNFPDLRVRALGTNALAYGFLALVNILRFSIQGMGFSQLAMLAGLMEMIARSAAGILLVPAWGFTAACLASPLAWVLADAFLIPATVLCIRHLEQPMHPARPHRLSHI